MEKISLILPSSDAISALETLRDLGVMHIQSVALPEKEDRAALEVQCEELDRIIAQLSSIAEPPVAPQRTGAEAREIALAELQAIAEADQKLEALQLDRIALEPWGNFRQEAIDHLAERGIQLYCCSAPRAEIRALEKAGCICVPVSPEGKMMRFAVIADVLPEGVELPIEHLPKVSLQDVCQQIARTEEEKAAHKLRFAELHSSLDALKAFRLELQEALEFAVARDSMAEYGILMTLTGFVPSPRLEELRKVAAEHHWGIQYNPADAAAEPVPTLLKKPNWAKLIDPLMEFLSLSPGYDDRAVRIPVLIFFTIFFGMLVGDVVYGTLFLGCSLAAMLTLGKKNPKVRQPAALMIILSLSAMCWGGLTGNYAGFSGPGLPWLASVPEKDLNVQLVCFILALVHLSLGHIIKAVTDFSWRNVIGQIGWVILLTANFELVSKMLLFPGEFPQWTWYSFGIGIVLAGIGEMDFR
ncbi:MAG: hypothetical protein J6Q65_08150, partial [Lentisphaeria bacterium]|nr:hypothetical protein [Lentisphaeria bacterium]